MEAVIVYIVHKCNRFFQLEAENHQEKRRREYQAHIYLVKNQILGLQMSARNLNNLLINARFLPTKLIAWESKELKTCGRIKL